MSKQAIKLYSSWYCPFAQRVWIALVEKGADFELKEIDAYDKTPEFLAVNPKGLVPVITDNLGRSIYESSVCLEYVDEYWPNTAFILPKDVYQRAHVRMWADFVTKKIVPKFYQSIIQQEKEAQDEAMTSFATALEELVTVKSAEGPYFTGQSFGLVDMMLVPFYVRLDVLKHYRGFVMPKSEKSDRFTEWMKACCSRESVQKTSSPKEKYISVYSKYANNTMDTQTVKRVVKSALLA